MTFYELIQILFFKQHNFEKNLKKQDSHKVFYTENHSNIISIWDYKNPEIKKMIRHMKKHQSQKLSKDIAKYAHQTLYELLADQQALLYFKKPTVIPIPISKKRLRERGFNQLHIWGSSLAQKINGSWKPNTLIKHRETKKQALIKNKNLRKSNVKNSFTIHTKKKDSIKGKDIILIDDLYTTGATLHEAERILKKAGARNIIMLTLAH